MCARKHIRKMNVNKAISRDSRKKEDIKEKRRPPKRSTSMKAQLPPFIDVCLPKISFSYIFPEPSEYSLAMQSLQLERL